MPWLSDGTWVEDWKLARDIVNGKTNYRPWSGDMPTAATKGKPVLNKSREIEAHEVQLEADRQREDERHADNKNWQPAAGRKYVLRIIGGADYITATSFDDDIVPVTISTGTFDAVTSELFLSDRESAEKLQVRILDEGHNTIIERV